MNRYRFDVLNTYFRAKRVVVEPRRVTEPTYVVRMPSGVRGD